MMQFHEVDGRRYAQFETMRAATGLAHAFSTRPSDLSVRLDDGTAQRDDRRRQMATDLGLDQSKLCCCVQVHQTGLAAIDEDHVRGRIEKTDALITDRLGVPLMCFSADCPLILAFDPIRHVVGVIHASWRCTVAGATRRLIEAMVRHYGCKPADMSAGIGPSAGPCCYEVKQDVFDAAAELPRRDELFSRRNERMYFDLWRANRAQLRAVGVPQANVETAELCTMCGGGFFYSFRREGAGCGHFGLMAGVTNRGA